MQMFPLVAGLVSKWLGLHVGQGALHTKCKRKWDEILNGLYAYRKERSNFFLTLLPCIALAQSRAAERENTK